MSLRHYRLVVFLCITAGISVFIPLHAERNEPARMGESVGLRELIALALQNDPGLVALRRNIPVEVAAKRAAVQWRDPELRMGVSRNDDLLLDHPNIGNRSDGDKSNIVRVRFFIPKPSEMKALVNQAARKVDLASYEVIAAERKVILEIREQYEELQYLSRKLDASRKQIAVIEQHVAKEKEMLDVGGAFTLDQLSFEDIKIPGIKMAIDAAETELMAAKRALAARVGLRDGSRIRVTDMLLRSGIALKDTDLDYLTLMAFAHRGEVGILKHEQAIAEAELGLVKTKRIPWFSFVETDYAQDVSVGSQTDEAYGVRVGVILPLFSWIAKEEQVVEARLDSYYASLEANQKSIANEVAEAFQSVKEASSYRSRTEAAVERHDRAMGERAKALDASEDLAAKEELRYETEIERNKFFEHQLAADRLFNQSLIRLERALGADLDQVLKVEYDTLNGASIESQKLPTRTPVSSSKPERSGIRARPVSQPAMRQPAGESGKPKRKGLFQFLKEKNKNP